MMDAHEVSEMITAMLLRLEKFLTENGDETIAAAVRKELRHRMAPIEEESDA